MGTYNDDFGTVQDLLAEAFGEAASATYEEPSGQSQSLTVILFGERTETPENDGVKTKLRVQECTWDADTVSDVNLLAKIEIDGEKWYCQCAPPG